MGIKIEFPFYNILAMFTTFNPDNLRWYYKRIYAEIMTPGFNINKAECVICSVTLLNAMSLSQLYDRLDPLLYKFNPVNCLVCIYNENHNKHQIFQNLEKYSVIFKYRSYSFSMEKEPGFDPVVFDISQLQPTTDLNPFRHTIIYQQGVWYEIPENLRQPYLAAIYKYIGGASLTHTLDRIGEN